MTYFHTGVRTIIGAESFHGPVRDGKGWDRLAMVIRLNWLAVVSVDNKPNSVESKSAFDLIASSGLKNGGSNLYSICVTPVFEVAWTIKVIGSSLTGN